MTPQEFTVLLASGQLPGQLPGMPHELCPFIRFFARATLTREAPLNQYSIKVLAPAASSYPSAHRNINKLSKEPTVLEQLANSLAPSIYGHETIKKGLVSWLPSNMGFDEPIQPQDLQGPVQVVAWLSKHVKG